MTPNVIDNADNESAYKQVSASLLENGKHQNDESSFESAVKASGFGKFNYILILAFIPFTCCQIFETNSITYVVPVAHCDLDLSLEGKGQLIAASYTGMILSGFFWGYWSDRYGRKTIMIAGFFLHWLCMLLASMSQSFFMLMVFKFFGGLVVNGPYSASASMLSEYHSAENRGRIQLARGVLSSMAHVILPLLSWGILPRKLDFTVFGYFEFHSWNVYLFVCSLVPLTSAILICVMSESPKFLMSVGKNEEAMAILRTMYRLNTGKAAHTYPIKHLVQEIEMKPLNSRASSLSKPSHQRVWMEIKPLFCPPLLQKLLLTCLNSFLVLSSTNTVRLWQPQLLQAVSDYQHLNNGSSGTMCEMLAILTPKTKNLTSCSVNLDNASVYLGSILVKVSLLVTFIAVTAIVNYTGKRLLLAIMASTAGVSAISIYFISDSSTLIAILAVFVSCSSVSLNVSSAITLELFPTKYRTKAISLFWITARLGTVIGNILFPPLLQAGCLPPFLFIALTIFGTAALSGLFPSTENSALK